MKKEYEAPKAERMEFNYTEAIVASNGKKCNNVTPMTLENTIAGEKCTKVPADDTTYADTF